MKKAQNRLKSPAGFSPWPLEQVHRLLEPGPLVLISTALGGRANLMTNGFNMPVQHSPSVIALVLGPWDWSYRALRETRECVVAIPPVSVLERVVDVGNVSGEDVDKWERFGFTKVPAKAVGAPLVKECFANLECRVENDELVEKYDLWLLKPVHAWVDPTIRETGEVHHRGDGTFSLNGSTVDLKGHMTKWRSLVD